MLTNDTPAPYAPACRTTPCSCDWYGDGPAPACSPCHVRRPGPGCGACVPAAAAPLATAGAAVDWQARAEKAEAKLAEREGDWLRVEEAKPDMATAYLVAAVSVHGGFHVLRRTFMYLGEGVWGLHGRLEHTRADITHYREIPDGPLD